MKNIVLIDDSKSDAEEIHTLLTEALSCDFHHFLDLREGMFYVKTNPVDLLLLDLEFTEANLTASSFIDDIAPSIPILIVSNLSHYQKPLSVKINVKGFISKSHLDRDLLTFVRKNLEPTDPSLNIRKKFVFPSPNSKHVSEAITVNDIRYIEFSNRQIYTVHLVDGTFKHVYSLPFSEICSSLLSENIDCLCPITKNQIVNLNCVNSITKSINGRLQIKLVNLPDMVFHVGKKHEEQVNAFFSLPKRNRGCKKSPKK